MQQMRKVTGTVNVENICVAVGIPECGDRQGYPKKRNISDKFFYLWKCCPFTESRNGTVTTTGRCSTVPPDSHTARLCIATDRENNQAGDRIWRRNIAFGMRAVPGREKCHTFICVRFVSDVSGIPDIVIVRKGRPQGRTSICSFFAGGISVLADADTVVKMIRLLPGRRRAWMNRVIFTGE